MSDHVYKNIELTGTSTKSTDEAVEVAIARASQTVKNMRWFQVLESRGEIADGKVTRWQVTVKIGFTIDDAN